MPWTWKQIEQDWLRDGRVAPAPSTVVEAFERVEACFGRDWIEQSRTLSPVVPKGAPPKATIDRGAYPVLTVVKMGGLLTSLEGIPGADTLIGKLRRGERAAMAEATAIHLLRQQPSDSEVELEPVVLVPGRPDKKVDFRVRRNSDPWTYMEVSATDKTATEQEAVQLLKQLAAPIHSLRGPFALELFFRNLPDNDEIEALLRRGAGRALVPLICDTSAWFKPVLEGAAPPSLCNRTPPAIRSPAAGHGAGIAALVLAIAPARTTSPVQTASEDRVTRGRLFGLGASHGPDLLQGAGGLRRVNNST
jgi:hypothetical protein